MRAIKKPENGLLLEIENQPICLVKGECSFIVGLRSTKIYNPSRALSLMRILFIRCKDSVILSAERIETHTNWVIRLLPKAKFLKIELHQ